MKNQNSRNRERWKPPFLIISILLFLAISQSQVNSSTSGSGYTYSTLPDAFTSGSVSNPEKSSLLANPDPDSYSLTYQDPQSSAFRYQILPAADLSSSPSSKRKKVKGKKVKVKPDRSSKKCKKGSKKCKHKQRRDGSYGSSPDMSLHYYYKIIPDDHSHSHGHDHHHHDDHSHHGGGWGEDEGEDFDGGELKGLIGLLGLLGLKGLKGAVTLLPLLPVLFPLLLPLLLPLLIGPLIFLGLKALLVGAIILLFPVVGVTGRSFPAPTLPELQAESLAQLSGRVLSLVESSETECLERLGCEIGSGGRKGSDLLEKFLDIFPATNSTTSSKSIQSRFKKGLKAGEEFASTSACQKFSCFSSKPS